VLDALPFQLAEVSGFEKLGMENLIVLSDDPNRSKEKQYQTDADECHTPQGNDVSRSERSHG
jgi:hypothetical protein